VPDAAEHPELLRDAREAAEVGAAVRGARDLDRHRGAVVLRRVDRAETAGAEGAAGLRLEVGSGDQPMLLVAEIGDLLDTSFHLIVAEVLEPGEDLAGVSRRGDRDVVLPLALRDARIRRHRGPHPLEPVLDLEAERLLLGHLRERPALVALRAPLPERCHASQDHHQEGQHAHVVGGQL